MTALVQRAKETISGVLLGKVRSFKDAAIFWHELVMTRCVLECGGKR